MLTFEREGRVKDKLIDAGVREVDVPLYIMELDAGVFDLPDMDEKWFEQDRINHSIRYVRGVPSEQDALYVAAFGPNPNLTRQAEVVRLVGLDRANEIAKQFGTTVGALKPGVDPKADNKDAAGVANPWHPNYAGKDRTKAIADWIARNGIDSAHRMMKSANATLSGKRIP